MLSSVSEIYRVTRRIVFENFSPEDRLAFDLFEPTDAGPNQAGDLFEQNGDFYLVETTVRDTRKAGPGNLSPIRVWGSIDISLFSKDRLDSISCRERLEEIGLWFAGQTLSGVRFREYTPQGEGRVRGFQMYPATVPFQFETQPKR